MHILFMLLQQVLLQLLLGESKIGLIAKLQTTYFFKFKCYNEHVLKLKGEKHQIPPHVTISVMCGFFMTMYLYGAVLFDKILI